MRAGTAHAVVRPAWNDPVIIKRLLDVGAQSLLIPYVETEEEAAARGSIDPLSAGRFSRLRLSGARVALGRIKGYHAAANAEICLLLQVETNSGSRTSRRSRGSRASTASLSALATFPPRLAIFVEHNHPEIIKTIDDTIRRIKAGAAPGMLTGDTELAQHYIELGCLFAAVGSDMEPLANGADQLAAKVQSAKSGR